mmetsp:Transcript_46592/g.120625  ORF Transcript_46592/g.120625 Transcript_46592/m.120625 type:complete len:273 (-) Transcript_46592:3-821(-)
MVPPALELLPEVLRERVHVRRHALHLLADIALERLGLAAQRAELVAHALGRELHLRDGGAKLRLRLVRSVRELREGGLVAHGLLVQGLDPEFDVLVRGGVVAHSRRDLHEDAAECLTDLVDLTLHLLLDGSAMALEVVQVRLVTGHRVPDHAHLRRHLLRRALLPRMHLAGPLGKGQHGDIHVHIVRLRVAHRRPICHGGPLRAGQRRCPGPGRRGAPRVPRGRHALLRRLGSRLGICAQPSPLPCLGHYRGAFTANVPAALPRIGAQSRKA